MSELFADFPLATVDAWHEKVEKDLKGADFDSLKSRLAGEGPDGGSLELQPLYQPVSQLVSQLAEGVGPQPLAAGEFGRPLPLHEHPSPEETGRRVALDLRHGATGVWLRFDDAGRAGSSPKEAGERIGRGGVALTSVEALTQALADLDPAEHEIHLDAGAGALPAAGLLLAWLQTRATQASQLRGSLGADPFGSLAVDGQLPSTLEDHLREASELARWCACEAPQLRALRVSAVPYHEAGGGAVDELAYALATGAAYLRRLLDPPEGEEPLEPDAACRQIQLVFAVSGDLFLEIAKLRAARRLWARLAEAVGASSDARGVHLHAVTCRRGRTTLDRGVNLLRGTAESFAATVGGADTVGTAPYDQAVGLPSVFSRRLAINTQLMLREESHLHRVADPGAGSGYVEALTEQLATAAWTRLQKIEATGGMAEALTSGTVARRLAESLERRHRDVCTRRTPLTGVSEYPNLAEEPLAKVPPDLDELRRDALAALAARTTDPRVAIAALVREPSVETLIAAAAAGAHLHELTAALPRATNSAGAPATTAPVLTPWRLSEPFEQLRAIADELERRLGWRPPASLLHLGDPRGHKARAEFVRNLLAVGGLDTAEFPPGDDDAFLAAFDDTDTDVAVLCGPDDAYPDRVPNLARRLRAAGATCIVLAGKAGEHEAAFRDAGVTHFAHLGSNTCQLLRELLASFDLSQESAS